MSPLALVSTRGVLNYTYVFRCSACGKHAELRRMPESLDGNSSLIAAFELAGIVICTHGAPRCAKCLAIPILFQGPERHQPVARTVRLPGPPCSPPNEGRDDSPEDVNEGRAGDGHGEKDQGWGTYLRTPDAPPDEPRRG